MEDVPTPDVRGAPGVEKEKSADTTLAVDISYVFTRYRV
jgi:hypothetical protein